MAGIAGLFGTASPWAEGPEWVAAGGGGTQQSCVERWLGGGRRNGRGGFALGGIAGLFGTASPWAEGPDYSEGLRLVRIGRAVSLLEWGWLFNRNS